jgi:murein hydrolase activator
MSKYILYLILVCFSLSMRGQISQQEKLEQRKAEIQAQIRENQNLLKKVKNQEKSVLTVIGIKNQKIQLKENLIATNESQTKVLNNNMYRNQVVINGLNKELDTLKADYAKMIVKSYKSRSEQSRAMFVLSASSFLQAYKRAQYMKQYSSFRKMQGDAIIEKTNQISGVNVKLNVQKVEKQKLIKENVSEKLILVKEKQEQQVIVNSIKKDKKKITVEINKQQQESRQIDRQIDRLIREAIAEANRRAAAAAAKANPGKVVTVAETKASESSVKIVLTPEGKIESDNFKNNKGRLPWPVERGAVSLKFGNQPHPIYPKLMIHNSGVEITTDQGSSARAVFAGEVTQVQVVSPINKAVIVKHGDFFTVYQNLSKVFVKEGDRVSIKQNLGTIRTSGDTGQTTMKFMISQNTTYANPALWLSNM